MTWQTSTPGASSSYTSTSPLRSSPLTAPPVFSPSRVPSPHPTLTPSRPRPIPSGGPSRRAASNPTPVPVPVSPPASPRQPLTPPSPPPLSRSHPLLGTYPLSLLHSRMSLASPHSLPSSPTSGFSLHLGALGRGKSCPPDLRCPPHLVVPFAATFYDLEDPSASSRTTPWVGNADVEEHYFSQARNAPADEEEEEPAEFPGYRIAPVGQLQLLVKTPSQAVKVFLVPYDLRGVPIGGRLLARERTYVQQAETGKESLRYAVQLQFTCRPAPLVSHHPAPTSGYERRRSSTTRRVTPPSSAPSTSLTPLFLSQSLDSPTTPPKQTLVDRAFYISKSIRLVFTSCPPEKGESLRSERTDEVVLPSDDLFPSPKRGRRVSMGRLDEWEMLRKKWTAKREAAADAESQPVLHEEGMEVTKRRTKQAESMLGGLPTIVSRPSTPTPELFPIVPQRTGSPTPQVPSVRTPKAQRYRERTRRGSGSVEERELSERLRELKFREAQHP